MYYRLQSPYALRGWEKMAWVLVRRPENAVRPLSHAEFQVLLLCDGQTDLAGVLPPTLQPQLARCEADGWIARCDTAQPLAPDQYYRYYPNRYVQRVFWSVTGRCNFRCRHCYMDAPDGALGELSTEEALDLIDQMAACGVLRVDLTGGEPLVRRDLWQLIDRILAHGMALGTLYTNGWLLTDDVLDAFAARGLKPHISVSFDGLGWHDWMRGVSGAEAAALDALRRCQARGFSTDGEMCLHRGNQDTLPQTVEALRAVGVEVLKVSNVSMTDLWRRHSAGNALTQAEYTEALLRYIPWFYQAGRPLQILELSGVAVLYRDKPYELGMRDLGGTAACLDQHLCRTARQACYITPEGRLLPCLPMTASPQQERFPLIRQIGLQQGLRNSLYMDFVDRRVRDLTAANAECAACPQLFHCGGGCRAMALTDGDHDLLGCDRLSCQFWKSGYAQRIRQIADEAQARWGSPSPAAP